MDYDEEAAEARRRAEPALQFESDDWGSQNKTAAIEAMYQEHQPQLSRFLRRRTNSQDVGDLVQECFQRLAASGADIVSRIEKPGAYLARAARNLLIERAHVDRRRFASAHHEYDDTEHPGSDPHAALEARDMMRRVEDRLERLKPKTRDIFLMHRFDGMTYAEIAAATGMSEKGVEKQIAKAMTAILRVKGPRS